MGLGNECREAAGKTRIPKDKPYAVWKISLPYFFLVLLLLVLTVVFLWNWKTNSTFIHKCSRYLVAGYLLKMFLSVILQANMVLSPYMEFPFTGMDMAEIMVLALLPYEGREEMDGITGYSV